jgi:ABC-type multidrug transport system fused ATPase/permease subunit
VAVFFALRRLEKRKTHNAYKTQVSKEISIRARIHEANSSLRELYVSSKLNWMTDRIVSLRGDSIKAGSVVALSQLRPKYIYEMSLFGGIGIIALISKMTGNREFILTYLVLFVVSSSRMIPGLLRVQYYMGVFQKSKDQTSRIFEILGKSYSSSQTEGNCKVNQSKPVAKVFTPSVVADALSFSFDPDKDNPTINNLSFKVLPGETVAIVGSSGAGKSTLVDLILGYQKPSSGYVQISGLEPRNCFEIWPGQVSYVPQKVTIYEDTLLANVAVGLEEMGNLNVREKVLNLLKQVELGDFVSQLVDGLDTKLSESGTSLSGGQIQRIGIARALFTNPSLLVLDESTSSLDSSTEHAVMDFIFKLAGEITLIIVAHRLSTIKSADRLFYMNKGKIEAVGDFETVKKLIPDFEIQVNFLKS